MQYFWQRISTNRVDVEPSVKDDRLDPYFFLSSAIFFQTEYYANEVHVFYEHCPRLSDYDE
jgi:hypothetical protein